MSRKTMKPIAQLPVAATKPLTHEELALFKGFAACQGAIDREFRGAVGAVVAPRLGVHPARILNIDINKGTVTIGPPPTAEPEPAKPGKE